MSKQNGPRVVFATQMSKQSGQGNKGGWPSTTGKPSGGNRSSNPAPASTPVPAPAPSNPSGGNKGGK